MEDKQFYVDPKFPTLEVGSRVFVKWCDTVKEHQIVAFRILNSNGELRAEVETRMGKSGSPQKFYLDTFMRGISEAQDMKISDIRE